METPVLASVAILLGFVSSIASAQADPFAVLGDEPPIVNDEGFCPDGGLTCKVPDFSKFIPGELFSDPPLAWTESERCQPDDPVCQFTCGQGLYEFDNGLDGPTVDIPNKRVVIPGPGLEGQQVVVFGHWTVCL